MKVYTYWDSSPEAPADQAEFFRIWEHSWRKHGWEPRILTITNAMACPWFSPEKPWRFKFYAFLSVAGGYFSRVNYFNNGLIPGRVKLPKRAKSKDNLEYLDPFVFDEHNFPSGLIAFSSVAEFKASGLCL